MVEDFMQTRLFGLVFCIFMFIGFGWMTWNNGYTEGYTRGIEENPKAKEVIYFMQGDGKIARFYGDKLLSFDLEENTVETLFPYKETLGEKQ